MTFFHLILGQGTERAQGAYNYTLFLFPPPASMRLPRAIAAYAVGRTRRCFLNIFPLHTDEALQTLGLADLLSQTLILGSKLSYLHEENATQVTVAGNKDDGFQKSL